MSFNRIGEDWSISGTMSAQSYYGDGSHLTGITSGSATSFQTNFRNQTGSTLYKGTVVYINGSTGNLPTVAKAQANSEATSAGTFGIVLTDVADNTEGVMITAGAIETLDTRTTATNPFTSVTLADGDTVYLDPNTAGYITNIKPSAPDHIVYIGKVIRTSPTNGYIIYRIQNGYELDEIHDVSIPSPQDGQVLTYQASTQLWTAQTPTGGGGTSSGLAWSGFGSAGTKIGGYRVVSSSQKAYKLVTPTTNFSASTQGINGEAIYLTKFYANPGEKINEIALRINTAGAAGLGLAAIRFLIYRSTLNANGEIIAGDLELDTATNINTLSTGIKVVTGLNHTLSSNTYQNIWYMGVRNYQTGSLQIRAYSNTDLVSEYSDLASAATTAYRDMSWYWSVPYTAATPITAPTASASTATTTRVAEWSQVIQIGYSA